MQPGFLLRKMHARELMLLVTCVVLIVYSCLPWRFASHYPFLKKEEILDALVEQVTRNISLQQNHACEYDAIIAANVYAYKPSFRDQIQYSEEIQPGGEYCPEECRPRFSSAIIVPYRQREEQLHAFLHYMHNYLRMQRIHYRIFLVEQLDKKPFNRAKLFNIGATIAAEYEFPCLILHDVDLLPLNQGQIYACSQLPRHMSSAIDSFRFTLPYQGLFGGVVAIRTEQFRNINGMSNMFHGWGGEDDDLYGRLKAHHYKICRFAPAYSSYTMLQHEPQPKNANRLKVLQSGYKRYATDGLNSLTYTETDRRIHSLFTHILVET